MRPRQPTTDNERPGRPHPPGTAGRTGPAGVPGRTHPEAAAGKAVSWTCGERLRCLWYRLRLTAAEMHDAARRMAKPQAPWISDDQSRQPRRTS